MGAAAVSTPGRRVAPPPPISFNPVRRLVGDWIAEVRAEGPLPPGPLAPSLARTQRFAHTPLPVLLELYERHGPVFAMRVFHGVVIFMIGAEANHYMLVSHAKNFRWRDGHMGDLIPLLGDGLLTIDGEFHRASRKAMLPAFHRERIEAVTATVLDEVDRAVERLAPDQRVDLYDWTRHLALRVAMRALFGFDPDAATRDLDPAREFEAALSFWSRDYHLQVLRGPFTPFDRMQRARRKLDGLILGEIARRRRTGERGEDIMSLLLDARTEDGALLDDDHLRDQVMTLLFAGHDTTTSTVAFLFHELARQPALMEPIWTEQDAEVDGDPTIAQLSGGTLPQLEMAIDETLRMYPPAWIGPRRSAESFEFAGVHVPGGMPVNYCSWATHHLPELYPDPEVFRPERFAAGGEASRLPKGAYVPFGGGSRTCIGMRFGQMEIRAIATRLLQRFRPELAPGYQLEIRQMPTISPKHGLPVTLRAR